MNWWLLAAGASEAVVTQEQLVPFLADIIKTIIVIVMVCMSVYTIIISLDLIPRLTHWFLYHTDVYYRDDYDDWMNDIDD